MPRGPLARSYPGAVALVVCSLVPYLALTAGVFPLLEGIARSTGLSRSTLEVVIAVSAGAYAAGTVLAVQFAVHLRGRRMLVLYEAVLVVASALAAWAPVGAVFAAAFIVQGLCTSLMLIAAVPPLVTRWPPKKMPITGMIMNLCIFGAVALGPTIGALEEGIMTWRPLFWGVLAVAVFALCFSLLTFEDDAPSDRSAPWDVVAITLAALGCAAAFFGAGELQAATRPIAASIVPLTVGAAMLVALVVYQFRIKNPLMPVKAAATTVPTTGIFIALTASAASFGIMELVLESLHKGSTPARTAVYFLPEFAAALAVAGLFGALFRTRFTPLLAFSGMLAIVGSAALLLLALPSAGWLVAAGTGMVGLGVAASVSPALFMAGFSMRSAQLQRIFAMIELLRGVTAFLVAPILLFAAEVIGSSGIGIGLWICLGIAALGFLGGAGLYFAGCGRLEVPDLPRWQTEDVPAWESPPLLARLRRSRSRVLTH
jgi:MFS family permease